MIWSWQNLSGRWHQEQQQRMTCRSLHIHIEYCKLITHSLIPAMPCLSVEPRWWSHVLVVWWPLLHVWKASPVASQLQKVWNQKHSKMASFLVFALHLLFVTQRDLSWSFCFRKRSPVMSFVGKVLTIIFPVVYFCHCGWRWKNFRKDSHQRFDMLKPRWSRQCGQLPGDRCQGSGLNKLEQTGRECTVHTWHAWIYTSCDLMIQYDSYKSYKRIDVMWGRLRQSQGKGRFSQVAGFPNLRPWLISLSWALKDNKGLFAFYFYWPRLTCLLVLFWWVIPAWRNIHPGFMHYKEILTDAVLFTRILCRFWVHPARTWTPVWCWPWQLWLMRSMMRRILIPKEAKHFPIC